MPLDETWMVQWSHFFEMSGAKPNYSRRIGPEVSADLLATELFGPLDDTGAVGLLYRDLLSNAFAGVWSVTALIGEIQARRPEIIQASRLLADAEYRRGALRAFLSEHRSASGLSDDDIALLANDPPLTFFSMFEAAHDTDGQKAGVLGSLILAEVLCKALDDRVLPEFSDANVACSFEDMAQTVFGDRTIGNRVRRCASSIQSMPDLVRFLAE